MQLVIRARTTVALDIVSLELAAADGQPLPPFEAGAHIDLHLGNGLARSYSLVNDPAERHRYVVSVQKDAASRGGSHYVHESLQVGQVIDVDGPRNNFKLVDDAPLVVLIAGGIGITPMYCMVQRLEALGRPWKLFFGARSRSRCAYLDEVLALEEKAPGRVQIHINDEHGGQVMGMAATVASVPADAHLYCCGPGPMLKAFEEATSGRPEDHVHVEYFSAAHEAASAGGFNVVLARATHGVRREGQVDPGRSAGCRPRCDALLQGRCVGACQTTVFAGQPDHRDSYLSPAERRSGKTIIPCCSGSLSKDLVLDI